MRDVRTDDGTHPSSSGQQNVAQMLQAFFDGSMFGTWYRSAGPVPPSPTPGDRVINAPSPVPTDTTLVAAADALADERPLIVIGSAVVILPVSTVLLALSGRRRRR